MNESHIQVFIAYLQELLADLAEAS